MIESEETQAGKIIEEILRGGSIIEKIDKFYEDLFLYGSAKFKL